MEAYASGLQHLLGKEFLGKYRQEKTVGRRGHGYTKKQKAIRKGITRLNRALAAVEYVRLLYSPRTDMGSIGERTRHLRKITQRLKHTPMGQVGKTLFVTTYFNEDQEEHKSWVERARARLKEQWGEFNKESKSAATERKKE